MRAKKGDWVQIYNVVLKPEERTGKIPDDTKKVPLEQWVKGFLNEDSNIGDTVTITTITERKLTGKLQEVNPKYSYGYGDQFIPELVQIDNQLKSIMIED